PHGVVELTRDRAQIQVDGHAMTLAAPVRAAHGRWQVPGDLLVRALPGVVGKGIRVTPSVAPPAAAAAARPAKSAAATVSTPARAAPGGPSPSSSSGELRYRSYPTYTRVVLEGETTTEPRLVETASGLVVTLPGLAHRGPVTTRAVRDGLVGGLELGATRIG